MTATTLQPAQHHAAQNSLTTRGHVIVLTGRGENAELYQRLGARLAFDGYAVSVVELPDLDAIDVAWLDGVELWSGARDAGALTFVGSDSGALVAAYLAARLGASAAVLAGIGGLELAPAAADAEALIAARSACPVHRGRLASSRADLGAPAVQRFTAAAAAVLRSTVVDVPALAIHGEADAVTPLDDALAQYRELAPAADVVTVAGGLHDILNDLTHRSVSAEIVQFLERGGRPLLTRTAPAGELVPAGAGR